MNPMTASSAYSASMRYALLMSLICFVPYAFLTPWWLLLLVLIAMGYRLISDYYNRKPLPKIILIALIIGCLVALKAHYGSIISSNFYIGFLFAFVGLKITELHNERDLKVLVFCNFYLIFSALILIHELWIITYLLIAILANLSLMLKLSSPQASLRQLGSKSFKQLLIAIPLSIFLFYLFPRIANPLWQVPSQAKGHLGFSEQMSPGSIAPLFSDDSTAFRVTFRSKPLINAYWRGLILNFYNGASWRSIQYDNKQYALQPLTANALTDYEILLEPHQQKWLFYTGYPSSSSPQLTFSPSYGLTYRNDPITQRFTYALQIKTAPYTALNSSELTQNTQFPKRLNPQLSAWAKQQYALLHNDTKAFIRFLQNYIHQEPFWYTLSPPDLQSPNQMDSFWFGTKKGFCEHYSSAVTLILRSAGIPARVVVGYQGGEWNPMARYLNVQQNNAHAWLEYWEQGTGWQSFDPTSFIAQERIDRTILEQKNELYNESNYSATSHLNWFEQVRLYWESAQFFAERWFLFYNQEAQSTLLQSLGFGHWDMGRLLQMSVGCVVLFILLFGLFYRWSQNRARDPLLVEYHLLQREFRRFHVVTSPPATLKQQCDSLSHKAPSLSRLITLFLHHYEQLRLQFLNQPSKEQNKQALNLLKQFRRKVKQYKVTKSI